MLFFSVLRSSYLYSIAHLQQKALSTPKTQSNTLSFENTHILVKQQAQQSLWWGDSVQLLTLTLLQSPFSVWWGKKGRWKSHQWRQRSGDHLPTAITGIRLDLGKVNWVYNRVGWQETKRKAKTLSPTLFPRLNFILCGPHTCTGTPETYTGIAYKVKKMFLWQCSCIRRRREIKVSGNPCFICELLSVSFHNFVTK